MKWLTTVLCLLAFHATAQELPIIPQVEDPDKKVITLPMFIQCTTIHPDVMLEEQYGELGFLDGEGNIFISPSQVLTGDFRMFLNPGDTHSFSIVFEVNELSCLVMTGEHVGPMVTGKGI